jgi:hypothetical protein
MCQLANQKITLNLLLVILYNYRHRVREKKRKGIRRVESFVLSLIRESNGCAYIHIYIYTCVKRNRIERKRRREMKKALAYYIRWCFCLSSKRITIHNFQSGLIFTQVLYFTIKTITMFFCFSFSDK